MNDKELTLEEKATNAETREHANRVMHLLVQMVNVLLARGLFHDQSKLVPPEMEGFTAVTGKLKGMEYGTDEYRKTLREIKPVIEHHYAHNRHHPEHFMEGVADMHLVDVMEMFCDWMAAAERMKGDPDYDGSIEKNVKRFGIDPQLASILRNTRIMLVGDQ